MSGIAYLEPASNVVGRSSLRLSIPTVTGSTKYEFTTGSKVIRGPRLSEVTDLRTQQRYIIEDLIYCFLGKEGFYIRYSTNYDPDDVNQKLDGINFKIAKKLDISLKATTKKLVIVGKYYTSLKAFVEVYNTSTFGRTIQSLCEVICDFMDYYTQVIRQLQDEFECNTNFNINSLESFLLKRVLNKLSHFNEIIVHIHLITKQRIEEFKNPSPLHDQFIHDFRESIQSGEGTNNINIDATRFNACKGGLVLQIIQNRINDFKGDSESLDFLTLLFDMVSQDYIRMLNTWLLNGEIDDPFDEFFIKQKQISENYAEFFHEKSEHYWNDLFVLKSDGLIEQLSLPEIQSKILITGKLLNIFKICTSLVNFDELDEHKLSPIEVLRDVEYKIEFFYKRANKLFMKMLFEGLNFTAVLEQLQSLFLFKNCSQFDSFLDQCLLELKTRKNEVTASGVSRRYLQKIKGAERQAVSFFHSSYEKPFVLINNILLANLKFSFSSQNIFEIAMEINRPEPLDTNTSVLNTPHQRSKIIDPEPVQSSTDQNTAKKGSVHLDQFLVSYINLSVELPFPLNLVIDEQMGYRYELPFKFLAMTKFLTKLNTSTWVELHNSKVWNFKNYSPATKLLVRKCKVLNKSVGNFLKELLAYINFDVTEPNYHDLNEAIHSIKSKTNQNEDSEIESESQNNDIKFSYQQNYRNTNNIFDKMIAKTSKNNDTSSEVDVSFMRLIESIQECSSKIIQDIFITNPRLLDHLKRLFDIATMVHRCLKSFKLKLVSSNEELYEQYITKHPGEFTDILLDTDHTQLKINKMSLAITDLMAIFNDALAGFVQSLQLFGETRNSQALKLSERLSPSL